MDGSSANPEAKEAPTSAAASPAGAQPPSSETRGPSYATAGAGADESAVRDERAATNRSLFMMQDHLAELDARLAHLEPWLRADALARTGLRGLAKILAKLHLTYQSA